MPGCREFISKWPCKKILVRGNHDSKTDIWYYEHGWDTVCQLLMIERFKKRIMLTHKPIADSPLFDINIHGHFHDCTPATVREKEPEIAAVLCDKHMLLAVEETNYRAILLDTFYHKRYR